MRAKVKEIPSFFVPRTFLNIVFWNDLIAALYASVSASYVVQQFGLPILSSGTQDDGIEHDAARIKDEVWNGQSPWMRLERLKGRMVAIS